jgi:hypothetical protein
MPAYSALEFQMVNQKLKIHKLPGNDKLPAELLAAGGRTIASEIPN